VDPDSGETVRTNYFKLIDEELTDYSDIELPIEVADRLRRRMLHQTMGLTVHGPIVCKGSECYYRETCDLYKAGQAPVGRECMLEVILITNWERTYMDSLDIDPLDSASMLAVQDLIANRLLMRRIWLILNHDHPDLMLTQDNVGPGGVVYSTKEVHPLLSILNRCERQVQRIQEDLVATRKAKLAAQEKERDKSEDDIRDLLNKVNDVLSGKVVEGNYEDLPD
jgi:hypothetical protein